MDPVLQSQAGGWRRGVGLALHAGALVAACSVLPTTLAATRYALEVGLGRGLVRNLVLFGGLAAMAAATAAAWVEWRRGPSQSPAALLRKAFVALVIAWLWAVFPQQDLIVTRPLPRLALALWALLFGISSLAAACARGRAPRARRALDLGLFSLAAALVLLEFGLQAAALTSTNPLFARQRLEDADAVLHARRLAPGAPHLGGRTNSRGYVDTEFPPERARPRRVVSIGDSFSIGVVPHAFHFTTVAEDLLADTEILNLGVSGIGPAQYRLLLEAEGLELAPDAVVIQLFAGNDLEEYVPEPHSEGWIWMQRRNVMLYLVSQRLRAIRRERARSGVDASELDRRLGRGLASGLAAAELERALPHLVDPALEPPTYSPEHFLELEVKRARQVCGPSAAEYARLLHQLEALHEEAGAIPLAFVVIPDEFQIDDALWAELTALAGEPDLERDRFQRVVLDWARARGVPALDLLPELRAVPPWTDGRPHLFHLRDAHFNRRGNRAAGEALARFLGEILPAPVEASVR